MHWWIAGITGFLSAIVTFVIWRRRSKTKAKRLVRQRISFAEMVRANELRAQSIGFTGLDPDTETLVRQSLEAQLRATTPGGERPTTAAEAARLSPFYATANLSMLTDDGRFFRHDSKVCFCAICGVCVSNSLKDLHFHHCHPEWKEGVKTLPQMEKEAIEAEKRRRREQRHESLREQVRNMPVEASLAQAWGGQRIEFEQGPSWRDNALSTRCVQCQRHLETHHDAWTAFDGTTPLCHECYRMRLQRQPVGSAERDEFMRLEVERNTVNGVPAEQVSLPEAIDRAQAMWLTREREEFERRREMARAHRINSSAARDEAIRQGFLAQTTNDIRAIIPGLPPDLPRAENG